MRESERLVHADLQYLIHPRTQFPAGEPLPSFILDDLTSRILAQQVRRGSLALSSASDSTLMDDETEEPTEPAPAPWRHSWSSTRARLFIIARHETMASNGGHRRRESTARAGDVGGAPKSLPMSRQYDSMDSLYGDESPHGMSEAMR